MALPKVFQQPPGYVVASILCALSGFSFGIETSIIGPVTIMDDFERTIGGSSQPTVQGLIVSCLILAAAISSLFAGKLADSIGRVWGIAIGTFIFAVGSAIQAASVNIAMFIVGRVIEGIGEGLYVGPMIVYICEISVPKYRAVLTTAPQLLHCFGLIVGFFGCYGTTNIPSSLSWRLPFIFLAAYSFAFTIMAITLLPPSPRWLTLRGRDKEAAVVWEKLGVSPADREKIIHQQSDNSEIQSTSSSQNLDTRRGHVAPSNVTEAQNTVDEPQTTILEAFSSPRSRRQLLFAVFLMGMQMMSGVDGVLFYAPLLFQQAGLSTDQSSFLASGVTGIVIFLVTVPATIWADLWGRRPSLVYGGTSMAVLMFLIGSLYAANAVHGDNGAGRWVVIVTIYIYVVIYCVTWGVHIKVYAAEIQPKRTRATAVGMAYVSYSISNFLVALITPVMLANTVFGAYFLFGACLAVTSATGFVFMPETRGKSLDDIEEAFHYKGPILGLLASKA
ncbi:MFS sugar transporter (H(+)-myo-inositol Co-transporter) [Seiridium cupressi]